MKFVYPEFLWLFGVLLIPIIIHLFNFRKYKILYFSSLQFLKSVEQQTTSVRKLKHYLVLLTRILLFSCLVIAFAQPFIPANSLKSNGGKPVLAIYIDNSFSMSMKGTEGELLSEAREIAKGMLNKVSADTRILLVTNEMSGLEQRLTTKIEALDRLDKIELSPLNRRLSEVIEWQKSALQIENDTKLKVGTKQFVILSDFQKNTANINDLKADSESFYYPVLLNAQNKSNLTIDSVWFSNPIQREGQNNEINIRIHNYSDKDLVNVDVKLEVGSIKRDLFVDIAANSSTSTSLTYMEQKSGYKQGKVSVDDRQFFVDDDYYFSYSVAKQSNILIVHGENSVPNIGLVYQLDNYYRVKELKQNQVTLNDLQDVDLVVVNGLNEIPSGLSDYINEFVKNGGALSLYPGVKLDVNSWNKLLNDLRMPLLGEANSNDLKIKNVNYQDIFFKTVFEKKPSDLNLPAIKKVYGINVSGNSMFLPLIELNNGKPLLVKSSSDKNVYLFSSSLDQSFSSFTSNALFSTVLLRIAELSKRKMPNSLIIGDDVMFPFVKNSKSEIPIHLKSKEVDFIPQTKQEGGMTLISIAGLEAIENLKAGTYSIIDEQNEGFVSLNYNRKESDVNNYTLDEIESIMEEKGIENSKVSVNENNQNFARIDVEKPKEYWRLMIVFAIFFALSEIVIIKFLKN